MVIPSHPHTPPPTHAHTHTQLASIVLKQYVETHWSRDLDDKFEEPEPPAQVCASILFSEMDLFR